MNNQFSSKSHIVKCNQCPVKNNSFCAILDKASLNSFSNFAKYRTYSDGQLVITEGKKNEFIGSVTHGMLKLYKLLDDGRQQIISLVFPGDMLGNIIEDEHSYFAEAIGEVTLCLYQIKKIKKFALTNPEVYLSILGKTDEQLNKARDWLLLLGRKSAKEKIASFLLLIAEQNAVQSTDDTFKIPLKRQEIADFLGLTIETVSRNFSTLKNQQLIREHAGHMLNIIDYNALKKIA